MDYLQRSSNVVVKNLLAAGEALKRGRKEDQAKQDLRGATMETFLKRGRRRILETIVVSSSYPPRAESYL